MSVLVRRPLAREAVLSAVVGAALAGLLIWLGPPGVDLAAHSYQRTFLLQHGFALWNNFWYAGRYSFVTYSFIYYPLAAVLGITVLAIASIGAAALAFTLVVWHEWGERARFSSRAFAVLWTGIVLSAAFPFALGMAFALLAISALQHGRRRLFALLLFATLLASPLAFLLLVLVLAGGALERPPRRATVAVDRDRGRLRARVAPALPGPGALPVQPRRPRAGPPLRRARDGGDASGRRRPPPLRPLRGLPRGAARRVRRAERPRLQRRAPQVRGDPARAARGDDRAQAHPRSSCRSSPSPASGTSRRWPTRLARPPPTRATTASTGSPRSTSCARTSARPTASRPSTPPSTGPPPTCRTPASRSCAAGTARTTSRRTSCSTTRRSAAPPTATGCAASASATS